MEQAGKEEICTLRQIRVDLLRRLRMWAELEWALETWVRPRRNQADLRGTNARLARRRIQNDLDRAREASSWAVMDQCRELQLCLLGLDGR